jgi:hypothetical protein
MTAEPAPRPKATKLVRSDLPFTVGSSATERLGSGETARDSVVTIVEVEGDLCRTSSGRWYCRHTGARAPKMGGDYRAIRSVHPPRPPWLPEGQRPEEN